MMDFVDGVIVVGIIILVMMVQIGWRLKQKLRITNRQIQDMLFLTSVLFSILPVHTSQV